MFYGVFWVIHIVYYIGYSTMHLLRKFKGSIFFSIC